MAIDPSRLLSGLQTTGLQNKDNPLYQLLFQIINALAQVSKEVNGGGGSGGSSITNNTINNFITQLLESSGASIEEGQVDNFFLISSGESSTPVAPTYDSPLTNGDSEAPEIIFDSFGDVVMVTGIPL